MKHGEKDDIFINRMLEETLRFLPERESGKMSTDLLAYYIKQDALTNFSPKLDAVSVFEELSLEYVRWEFLEKTSCFRFTIGSTVLDIPANWSFFNKIFVSYQTGREDFYFMTKKSEESHFVKVVNLLTPYFCDLAFWVSDQKIFMVMIPEEKKAILPELQKKLGLENLSPIKKAA